MTLCWIVDCDDMNFLFCCFACQKALFRKMNVPLIWERLKFQNFLLHRTFELIDWLIDHINLFQVWKNRYTYIPNTYIHIHPDVEFVNSFTLAILTYFTLVLLVTNSTSALYTSLKQYKKLIQLVYLENRFLLRSVQDTLMKTRCTTWTEWSCKIKNIKIQSQIFDIGILPDRFPMRRMRRVFFMFYLPPIPGSNST